MTPEEESRLEAKAEIAGIPPRSGSLNRANLSEAARQAIEAWQPAPPPRAAPAADASKRKLPRVSVHG